MRSASTSDARGSADPHEDAQDPQGPQGPQGPKGPKGPQGAERRVMFGLRVWSCGRVPRTRRRTSYRWTPAIYHRGGALSALCGGGRIWDMRSVLAPCLGPEWLPYLLRGKVSDGVLVALTELLQKLERDTDQRKVVVHLLILSAGALGGRPIKAALRGGQRQRACCDLWEGTVGLKLRSRHWFT